MNKGKKFRTQNPEITKEEVKHVAKLARLELTAKEVKKFQRQLNDVLDYISQLEELDTKGVEPTSQVTGLEDVNRVDKITPSISQTKALIGSKNVYRGMFKIRAIFE